MCRILCYTVNKKEPKNLCMKLLKKWEKRGSLTFGILSTQVEFGVWGSVFCPGEIEREFLLGFCRTWKSGGESELTRFDLEMNWRELKRHDG